MDGIIFTKSVEEEPWRRSGYCMVMMQEDAFEMHRGTQA
jgi:hypothetical protein